MKRAVTTITLVLGVAGAAQAQSGTASPVIAERRAVEHEAQAGLVGGRGRARATVEARVTRGAPYSGEAITEFTQQLPDGNRISRRSVTRTVRDSDGRTRRERANDAGETTSVVISDPVAGTSYVLDPQARTAGRARVMVAGMVARAGRGGGRGGAAGSARPAAAPPMRAEAERELVEKRRQVEREAQASGGGATATLTLREGTPAAGERRTEDLGTRMIEGVMAEGSRTTTVLPAGAIGNAQPITIVSEQWFSPDLHVLVMTRHSDPRTGETVYRLANIVRGEPDQSLFQVPADYTVK